MRHPREEYKYIIKESAFVKALKDNGFNKRTMCQRMGRDTSWLSKVCKGVYCISETNALRICKILSRDLEEIFVIAKP